jgi:hypothetical protein
MTSKELWELNNMALTLIEEQAVVTANQIGKLFGDSKDK